METFRVHSGPKRRKKPSPAPIFMTCVVLGLLYLVFYGISTRREEDETDLAPAVEDQYVKRDGSSPNPLVWFAIRIGKTSFPQRLVFELFSDVVPRTAENFRQLCVGFKNADGRRLTYKGSKFHQIIPGLMARGGDITSGDGMGGYSIYGPTFTAENYQLSHTRKYQLSMANIGGPDTISSQFFITTAPAPWLDGKHVVIGKVISGHEIVDAIEAEGTKDGRVSHPVTIVDSGEVVPNIDRNKTMSKMLSNLPSLPNWHWHRKGVGEKNQSHNSLTTSDRGSSRCSR
ncbi:hypothetical protein AAMO2058_000502000 [Amorphochlora amoebiformis]|uniref:Peptidyl-prolyl cis-trans isomerase n=1 Tax=Amorphochlora amoebiformis TaxID=1561963 RepID=A0A7S0DJ17_9EUKA|mmetsp:Transcript_29496/g.47075  ORF Transcript_29496/g.47075 Transcript_29496/m.47075 type:complete len:287 (+) Transcript_29496:81-941(+)